MHLSVRPAVLGAVIVRVVSFLISTLDIDLLLEVTQPHCVSFMTLDVASIAGGIRGDDGIDHGDLLSSDPRHCVRRRFPLRTALAHGIVLGPVAPRGG